MRLERVESRICHRSTGRWCWRLFDQYLILDLDGGRPKPKGLKYMDAIRIRLVRWTALQRRPKSTKITRDYFQSLEDIYGVPSGILLAIHGMETGFGRMGRTRVVDSILTALIAVVPSSSNPMPSQRCR